MFSLLTYSFLTFRRQTKGNAQETSLKETQLHSYRLFLHWFGGALHQLVYKITKSQEFCRCYSNREQSTEI